jgi:hypothetical protein
MIKKAALAMAAFTTLREKVYCASREENDVESLFSVIYIA